MPRYKMIHVDVGDEVQVSFLCQHCTVNTGIQPLSDSYETPYKKRIRQAGECPRCEGTGFDPEPLHGLRMCVECGGTGVCPSCGGRFLRAWTELPIETQDRFLKNWEKNGTFPKNYAANSRFYNSY